jgi:GNAT superfamily N-acetyltransferase
VFYNFRAYTASGSADRSRFAAVWWRSARSDPRWAPPYYPHFRRELEPDRNPFLVEREARYFHLEAMLRRERDSQLGVPNPRDALLVTAGSIEIPVAATVTLVDRRRADRAAYLGLLQVANDSQALELLISQLAPDLHELGIRKLIGPVGLSPLLDSGSLLDNWDQVAPIYAGYNPPFYPEVIAAVMEPFVQTNLYRLPVPASSGVKSGLGSGIQILPLEALGAGQLATLAAKACLPPPGFPPTSQAEAEYVLRATAFGLQGGWAAFIDGKPAGFVLLHAHLAPALLRWGGGRRLHHRLFLKLAARRPAKRGRIVLGGVAPEYSRKGAGSALLARALETAREYGWQELAAGPVHAESSAAAFLLQQGAQPAHTYQIFSKQV